MYEALRIVRENDPVKRVNIGFGVGETVVCRCGDGNASLFAVTFKHNDDVFLQNIIIFESTVTGGEKVNLLNRGFGKKKLDERADNKGHCKSCGA